ncbi:hypothetical protein Desor_1151 [Desulfosporosinus orientis DSM 765]|uniref:Phospholipase C/D domain-containing protein n=1 Tax=Desulfosporosinus orientis (strain ATCC 19365 / DSM 765 / NCIMB 8382 / VKM B-1628 / Singapore I) TaxID=768706 RepID=G7WAQ0_DESOD|nr:zinc dependent phospholipase C family protein [Desulfosporosinus orientis]AET66818.1 hypothetical protein Desor_1151 [Desulfosporosinus orientis DSM 765]
MPKELTHWHIAREALHRGIPLEVGKIITGNPVLYYIGAVAHDIPFYDMTKPMEARIEGVANQLHGVAGENTLTPLIEMMETALAKRDSDNSLAFLLGMLTHFVADSVFHPMVYYLSGNYFANDPEERSKAVFRHRLLETAMDLWLQMLDPLDYPMDLNGLWRDSGEEGRQALRLIVNRYAYQEDKSFQARFEKAWRNQRFLQTAFSWSMPWRVLAVCRRYGYFKTEKLEALFYSQPLDLSYFNESLDWQHPISGEAHKMSLHEIYDLSVKKVIILFEQLAEYSREKWPQVLGTLPPLSLDTGLPYVPVADMRFFRNEPIEYQLRFDIRKQNKDKE